MRGDDERERERRSATVLGHLFVLFAIWNTRRVQVEWKGKKKQCEMMMLSDYGLCALAHWFMGLFSPKLVCSNTNCPPRTRSTLLQPNGTAIDPF